MEGRGGWPMTEFFCQQAALHPSLQWNVLHPAIQASTLLSITPNAGQGLAVCAGTSALFAHVESVQQLQHTVVHILEPGKMSLPLFMLF